MRAIMDQPTQNGEFRLVNTELPAHNDEQIKAIESYNIWISRLKKFCTNRSTRHNAWKSGRGTSGAGYLIQMCNTAINDAIGVELNVDDMISECRKYGEQAWKLEVASSIGKIRIALQSNCAIKIIDAALTAEYTGGESAKFGVYMKSEMPFIKFHREVTVRAVEEMLNAFPEEENDFGKRIWKGNVVHMLNLANELQIDTSDFRNKFRSIAEDIPKYITSEY